MIKILYFASLRERIDTDAEQMELPAMATIDGIMEILRARDDAWADAFSDNNQILAAINQEMANTKESIKDGDEIAFFPPVTGG